MKWIAAAAGLLMMAPAGAPTAAGNLDGPEVIYIGSAGTDGSVRVSARFAGGKAPVAGVFTKMAGVEIRDVVATADAGGSIPIEFTIAYIAAVPAMFEVEVYVSNGKPTKFERKSEFEKIVIPVKRM